MHMLSTCRNIDRRAKPNGLNSIFYTLYQLDIISNDYCYWSFAMDRDSSAGVSEAFKTSWMVSIRSTLWMIGMD